MQLVQGVNERLTDLIDDSVLPILEHRKTFSDIAKISRLSMEATEKNTESRFT